MGMLSADEMNEKAVTAAKMRTWAVRLGGFLIMGMGLATIVGPLAVLGDVIPFIGSLIRGASGFVAFCVSWCPVTGRDRHRLVHLSADAKHTFVSGCGGRWLGGLLAEEKAKLRLGRLRSKAMVRRHR